MTKRNRIILTVILPLIIGGLTYILFRADSLRMFKWLDFIRIGTNINIVRNSIGHSNLPAWIIFSLPDALWVFSFTSFMLIIWKGSFSLHSFLWILIAPIIGLLSEIGQAFHFVRGTFDITDFTLILIASILPFAFNPKQLFPQIV